MSDAAQDAPVLVLGLGNPLLADDGVGLELLELLRAELSGERRVELVDGGTLGASLVGLLEGRRALLLLDAVRRGAPPGRVHLELAPERVDAPRGLGAHGGNAAELLAAARLLDALPGRVELVGVEPAELRTRLGLSPAVARALPRARALARERLRHLLAGTCTEGAPACTS